MNTIVLQGTLVFTCVWCVRLLGIAITITAMAAPAMAAPTRYDVPPLPLVQAMERLSTLAGVSIGGGPPIGPNVRSSAVRGAASVKEAIDGMLKGTGLSAVRVDAHTYRLVVADHPKSLSEPAPASLLPPEGKDVVVIASKRGQPLVTAGSDAEVVSFSSPLGAGAQRGTITDLADRLPALSSTRLGRGRDKLFLRGIADSSFSGTTQATLGEYLGEARINYSAPDPGLLLYDVRQVELLKGPQGTLYGGGTLGGVLRIEPERPDLNAPAGFVDVAGSITSGADTGSAVAGMVNIPLMSQGVGVRLLAYRREEGGYIDDVARKLRNVNRSTVGGARAQARSHLGAWTIDLLATHQRVATADSSYAAASLPPLRRASSVAQPSTARFDLLDAELTGKVAGAKLVSATSASRYDLRADYDASVLAQGPTTFREVQRVKAVNHETRLSRSSPDGSGWVLGIFAFGQRQVSAQSTDRAIPDTLDGAFVIKRLDVGGFAQASVRRGPATLDIGLRTTRSTTHLATDRDLVANLAGRQAHVRVSPMAEVAVKQGPTTLSLSYREGWRSGGAAIVDVAQAHQDTPVGLYLVPYDPDHLRVLALGFAYRTRGDRPFTALATLSGVDWDHIQSASLDNRGLVYTTSADSADLLNLDVTGSWRMDAGLTMGAGFSITKAFADSFFNDGSGLFGASGIVPSVPDATAFAGAEWSRRIGGGWDIGVEGRLSYLGRSRLGLDRGVDASYGKVVGSRVAVRLARSRYVASVEMENVGNDRSSLFGYGNPFTLRAERQLTPQRPRTITLGLHADF